MISVAESLFALGLLQLKHLVFDFLLQPAFVWKNKGTYGHPGGLLHALGHTLGTLPALFILTSDATTIAVVLVMEGIVHYHIDWGKEKTTARLNLTPQNPRFWYLLGFDQLLHQVTYLLIIWYLVT